jgi:dolichol-phosphate mannosyltransferase
MSTQYSYNIHDVISVNSEVILPELELFMTKEHIANPTIDVVVGKPSRKNAKPGTRHLFYTELLRAIGFEAEIEVSDHVRVVASPLLRLSPHVLYTNLVEPILRWTFVQKGYALVHGATIAFGDKAYMITARTDTGKTTTLLKILDHQRRDTDKAAFISDDLTIVSPTGEVMTYPKPLTISAHTVRAINSALLNRSQRFALAFQSRIHSRSGRRFAFQLNTLRMLPMATINALVQFIVPPPKYHVSSLVPKVKLAEKAKLAGLFIIERGEEMDAPLDPKEALEILLSNCEDAFGFPPYNAIKEFLYLPDGKDLRPAEQSIIRSALTGIPANLIRSNTLEWWRRIPTFVGDDVAIFFSMHPERANGSLRRHAVRV